LSNRLGEFDVIVFFRVDRIFEITPDSDNATQIGETPTHDGIYERHPITDAVADAIMLTATPAGLPGTPLGRLLYDATEPEM
jgi:hypothetical protein